MTTLARFFDGRDINGEKYVVKIAKMKEISNNRMRAIATDSVGEKVENLILSKEEVDRTNVQVNDQITILEAKSLTLKNGRPAYHCRKISKVEVKLDVKTPLKTKVTNIQTKRSNANLVTLANLTPYSSIWEVEVVLLKKDPIREWKKNGSEGKVQNLLVSDDSGRIRVTLWRDDVDKFQFLEIGKTFRISNCQIKPCDKAFNKTGLDYELHSKIGMTVEEVVGGTKSGIRYNFIKISEIEKLGIDQSVDVVGILNSVEDIRKVTIKSQDRESSVRNITIADDSMHQIRGTLWGKDADTFEGKVGTAMEIKCAALNEFQGKNLAFRSDTLFRIKDQFDENVQPETQNLFSWWNNGGSDATFSPLSGGGSSGGPASFTSIQIEPLSKIEAMGTSGEAEFFETKVWITHFAKQDNCFYLADPESNKKVNANGDGTYQTNEGKIIPECSVRLLLNSIKLSDDSYETWASCFNDQAEIILKVKGDEVLEAQKDESLPDIFSKACFKEYFMKLKVKEETYQDQARKRITIMKCAPVDNEQLAKFYMSQL